MLIFTDDEDTITEFMFPENERKSRDDEVLHEKDHHPHLTKLLSTVGQSVTSDMDRREKVATVVAQINKKLRQSVHECKCFDCNPSCPNLCKPIQRISDVDKPCLLLQGQPRVTFALGTRKLTLPRSEFLKQRLSPITMWK